MVSQGESLVDVQVQAASDGVTVKEPVPPVFVKLPPCGFRVKLHAAPLCVIVRSAKPPVHETRIDPVRGVITVLAAPVQVSAPGVFPEVAPSVIPGGDGDCARYNASPL